MGARKTAPASPAESGSGDAAERLCLHFLLFFLLATARLLVALGVPAQPLLQGTSPTALCPSSREEQCRFGAGQSRLLLLPAVRMWLWNNGGSREQLPEVWLLLTTLWLFLPFPLFGIQQPIKKKEKKTYNNFQALLVLQQSPCKGTTESRGGGIPMMTVLLLLTLMCLQNTTQW